MAQSKLPSLVYHTDPKTRKRLAGLAKRRGVPQTVLAVQGMLDAQRFGRKLPERPSTLVRRSIQRFHLTEVEKTRLQFEADARGLTLATFAHRALVGFLDAAEFVEGR